MMTDKQLTFLPRLNNNRELELHIPVNPSVDPKDAPRLSRQAQSIYNQLKKGPAATSELAGIGLQYCARVNEVRHYLVKHGKMIDEIAGSNGNNQYRIVDLTESVFWKKVKNKRETWKWIK